RRSKRAAARLRVLQPDDARRRREAPARGVRLRARACEAGRHVPAHAARGDGRATRAVTTFLCKTCGTQFPESHEPPRACPICEDERQYVPVEGQEWVEYDDVRAAHRADIREEQLGLTGSGTKPSFGIGQRALLLESPGGNVLWDCLPLLEGMASFVESRGGLRAIAISHPHYYSTMVEWAHRFDCRVLIHELE